MSSPPPNNPPDWNKRPARIQIDDELVHGPNKIQRAQMGTIYNIWYHKWSGGERGPISRDKPVTRINVLSDVGMTVGESSAIKPHFCLFFARGCCPHGLPERHDVLEGTKDCFGRDLFAQLKDDMGGVGSFLKEHRTLYIGRISSDNEHVEVLDGKGVAFVTYTNRHTAEFAKEALSNQSLDHNEMVNVRWATEDPNPRTREEIRTKAEEEAQQIIEARMVVEEAHKVAYEKDQQVAKRVLANENAPQEKRQKKEKIGFLHPELLESVQNMAKQLPSLHLMAGGKKNGALELLNLYEED